jgi:hypothetical protein
LTPDLDNPTLTEGLLGVMNPEEADDLKGFVSRLVKVTWGLPGPTVSTFAILPERPVAAHHRRL